MITAAVSDKDLVRQILDGQRDAFAVLVERYLQSALAVARARLLNPIDADDAVQEAFLRAFAQLRTLREPAKFGPWLLTIVRHEAARFVVRRNSTLGADAASAAEAATTPDPSQQEVHALLRSRIEQLPESAREVLLLHYFAGRTTREIAELLDLRQAAVLKRLQRAREALAENMLHELEADRPAESSLAKQAARIAAIASTLTLPTAIPATASAIAWAGFFPAKWIAVAAILASMALVLGAQIRGKSAPTTAHTDEAAPPYATPVVAVVEGDANIATDFPADATATATDAAEQTIEERFEPKTLTGSWYFNAFGPPDAVTREPEEPLFFNKHFRFEDDGTILKMVPTEEDSISIGGQGQISAERLIMHFVEYGPGNMETVVHLEGKYLPESTQFTLSGWLQHNMQPQEAFPDGVVGEKKPVQFVWTRKSLESVARSNYVDARVQELDALYDALVAFANDHQRRMPRRLEDLIPRYLPSLAQFSPEAGITSIDYTPLDYLISGEEVNRIFHDAIVPVGDAHVEREQRRDLEALLRRLHRNDGSGIPLSIVHATYNQHELSLTLNAFGDWRAYKDDCNEKFGRVTREERVLECGERMGRTALAIKSFMNAWSRGPEGWLTLLRWNLANCSLYCAGQSEHIFARELLFPSASIEELVATYEHLFGPFDNSKPISALHGAPPVHARIPIVIETAECSGSGGRHVGFLDGHVEFRKGRLEDYPDLAPFLNPR